MPRQHLKPPSASVLDARASDPGVMSVPTLRAVAARGRVDAAHGRAVAAPRRAVVAQPRAVATPRCSLAAHPRAVVARRCSVAARGRAAVDAGRLSGPETFTAAHAAA